MGMTSGGHPSANYRTPVSGALAHHRLSLPPQEANCKNHRVNRVVFLGNTKRLLTTGVSRWNTRQIALWDQVSRRRPGVA